MLVDSVLPLVAMLISLAAIPLILLSDKRPNLRESWTLLAAVLKFIVVLMMLPAVRNGEVLSIELWEIVPGATLAFKVDALGYVFAFIASGLWILTSFYSIGYVRGAKEHKQTRYYASFAFCLSSVIGICFSANLITFLVFFELLTLSTFPLVIHKETPAARAAANKYLAYTLPAGLCLVLVTGVLWTVLGQMDFVAGGFVKPGMLPNEAVIVLFVFALIAVGVKAGVMPLHSWLPSAMAAPTPVSSLLHAVAVVKAGAFGVLRMTGYVFSPEILFDLGLDTFLAALAAFTLTVASLIAFAQDNLKKRLAYSTVGHLSYIVLGAALLTPAAWNGAVLHMMFHATMKITLFFCAGAIYVHTHKTLISELDGIGRQMPITMTAFTIGSLGLAGVPGINGFISKWYLVNGAMEAESLHGGGQVFMLLLVLSGVLNAGYFFPIVHRAFFKPLPATDSHGHATPKGISEASPFMVGPLALTAAMSLFLGLFPAGPSFIADQIANSVTKDEQGIPRIAQMQNRAQPTDASALAKQQ